MESDEKVIFDQSWSKMKTSLHSEGYREGSSLGRDSTFQQGFDSGYSEGFQAGYALGLHNGVLRCLKSDASALENSIKQQLLTVEEVDKASRGICVICSKESDRSNNSKEESQETWLVTDVKEMQKNIISKTKTHIMTENYSTLLNSVGLESLFKG